MGAPDASQPSAGAVVPPTEQLTDEKVRQVCNAYEVGLTVSGFWMNIQNTLKFADWVMYTPWKKDRTKG